MISIIDDWNPCCIERKRAVPEGKWESKDTFDGLAKGKVLMAPYRNMPDDVKKLAETTEAGIKAATMDPFKRPVVNQAGQTVECKGGDRLSDKQVFGMLFHVQGIEDTIPQ